MQVRVGFWVTFKHLTQISLYVVFFYLKFAFKMQIIYLKVILIEAEKKKKTRVALNSDFCLL